MNEPNQKKDEKDYLREARSGAMYGYEDDSVLHEHNWTPVVDQRYELFVIEYCPDCDAVREMTKEGCQKPSVLLSEAPQHVRNLFDKHGNRLPCES